MAPAEQLLLLQLNHQSPLLKDKRIRQALIRAIDNQALAGRVMEGYASAANQLSEESFAGYLPSLKDRFNLRAAFELLSEVAKENPSPLELTLRAPTGFYSNDDKLALMLKMMLERVQFQIDFEPMTATDFINQNWHQCGGDLQLMGWFFDTFDTENAIDMLLMPYDEKNGRGVYNCYRYDDEALNQLMEQVRGENNPEQRAQLLQAVEQYLYDEAVIVPLYRHQQPWAFRKGMDLSQAFGRLDFPYVAEIRLSEPQQGSASR